MEKKPMQCYEKKYICYKKQLKSLYKFMLINIHQQIITLNIP